jgi:hypothetical protein
VLAEGVTLYEIQVPAKPGLIPGATAAKMLSPQNVVEFLDAVDAHKGEIRLVSPSGEAGEFRLDVAYIRRAIARYGATIGAVVHESSPGAVELARHPRLHQLHHGPHWLVFPSKFVHHPQNA